MLSFTISCLKSAKTSKLRQVLVSRTGINGVVLISRLFWHQHAISIFFSSTMYYTSHCELPYCTSMVPFLFYWKHLKAGTVHSSDSSLFRKMMIICQSNVPAITAENEEQNTLSNIIYIGFQNSYSFLWSFSW